MRLLCNNFRCEFQNKCKHEKIDKLMRSGGQFPIRISSIQIIKICMYI